MVLAEQRMTRTPSIKSFGICSVFKGLAIVCCRAATMLLGSGWGKAVSQRGVCCGWKQQKGCVTISTTLPSLDTWCSTGRE